MSKTEKSLLILDNLTKGAGWDDTRVDPRSALLVTLFYLCFMLSVPTTHIDILLWYALYPIIAAPIFGLSYGSIFVQSLIVLPLVLLLGMFNPIFDKTPVAEFNGWVITNGWLLFFGIILRGLLSMQALLILIQSMGFIGLVKHMRRLGVPKFLVTQLLLVFRYIRVLIEEGITMRKAINSRSYGQKHLSIRLWGVLVGQLFLRSVDRAERVNRAMLARGFEGNIPFYETGRNTWNMGSSFFLVGWSVLFLLLRLFNPSLLFV